VHFEIIEAYKVSEGTCLASSRKDSSHSFVAFRSFVDELLLLGSLITARTSFAYTLHWLADSIDPFKLSLFPHLISPSTVQESLFVKIYTIPIFIFRQSTLGYHPLNFRISPKVK